MKKLICSTDPYTASRHPEFNPHMSTYTVMEGSEEECKKKLLDIAKDFNDDCIYANSMLDLLYPIIDDRIGTKATESDIWVYYIAYYDTLAEEFPELFDNWKGTGVYRRDGGTCLYLEGSDTAYLDVFTYNIQ